MYIVTDANTNNDYSTPTSGNKDRDPDNGSAKHVHMSTRPVNSKIRMDRTQEHEQGMEPGVAKKCPSTLLIKAPAGNPRKEPPRRTSGIPGRAAGCGAR
eukprot:145882-Lingulodinium_polyedra.AAC.1